MESSDAQMTSRQSLSAALALAVHAIPLGDVITRFPVPETKPTAQNKPNSGAQHTEVHGLFIAARVVHSVPLDDVMTLFVVEPDAATATKRPVPPFASAAQHTPHH
jgi:hypothetical protein